MESVVVLAIIATIAYYAYRSGKRIGSRKGFHAGRRRGRRR
jgi:Tfp pilus assembly protein PilE